MDLKGAKLKCKDDRGTFLVLTEGNCYEVKGGDENFVTLHGIPGMWRIDRFFHLMECVCPICFLANEDIIKER